MIESIDRVVNAIGGFLYRPYIVPLFLLAACKEEPRFEERYDKAAKEIEARAKAMDADIAESEKAAAEVGAGSSGICVGAGGCAAAALPPETVIPPRIEPRMGSMPARRMASTALSTISG